MDEPFGSKPMTPEEAEKARERNEKRAQELMARKPRVGR